MAKEAIEEIKRAEEAAKQMLEEAEKKAAEITADASKQAAQSKQELKDSLKQEYDKALADAKKKVNDISILAENAAKDKAESEKKRIFQKKETAIEKVMEAILQP